MYCIQLFKQTPSVCSARTGLLAARACVDRIPCSEMESGRLLVLNAGSSSLKFALYSLQPLAATVGGLIERIGDVANSTLKAKGAAAAGAAPRKWQEQVAIPDHMSGMEHIMRFLKDNVSPKMDSEVVAVGHRVVHGLDLHKAALLTPDVVSKIEEAATLAPLHNPPGLQGIRAALQVFSGVPQVRTRTAAGRRVWASPSSCGSLVRWAAPPIATIHMQTECLH